MIRGRGDKEVIVSRERESRVKREPSKQCRRVHANQQNKALTGIVYGGDLSLPFKSEGIARDIKTGQCFVLAME
jgi:hypothetical protein